MCNKKVFLLHKKPSGAEGALRAEEVWLLKQPRSGARIRITGLLEAEQQENVGLCGKCWMGSFAIFVFMV